MDRDSKDSRWGGDAQIHPSMILLRENASFFYFILERGCNVTMAESSLTTLIDIDIDDGIDDDIEHEGDEKWNAFVDGKNGFFYGISSRRVSRQVQSSRQILD